MTIFYIILGIFIYLIIGTTVTKLYNHFGVIDNETIQYWYSFFVIIFPIVILWNSTTWIGKWIAKTIYDKIRLFKFKSSERKRNKQMKKALDL